MKTPSTSKRQRTLSFFSTKVTSAGSRTGTELCGSDHYHRSLCPLTPETVIHRARSEPILSTSGRFKTAFTMTNGTLLSDFKKDKMKKADLHMLEERARSYQIEMFEYAKKNNTIVCLGTGTGKTFVSVLLIKHFENEVSGPWKENGQIVGKRTVFLAPNVPLVEQQSSVIAQHMTVKVGTYIGAMQTDRWTRENWDKECSENGILVMTPEIFRLAIKHGLIPLERINLLVLDECHAATGGHPYFEIMKTYKELPNDRRPRILGLTASVVNAQVHGPSVPQKVRDLESTLSSTAKTASGSVVQFGTKPVEVVLLHNESSYTEFPDYTDLLELLVDCADFKEFKKALVALKNLYTACGPFCAKTLIDFRERELEKAVNHPDCAEGFRKTLPIRKDIYARIRNYLGENPSIDEVPPRLKRLLEMLKLFKNGNLSGIVFVKERLTAYVLYVWMSRMSRRIEWSFVRPSFIVGQNSTTFGRELDYDSFKMNSKAQQKVMKDFRNDEYNLMFATSVIEEGMDVPVCNLIVRFDPPADVRSYTQSKGRARAKPSLYAVLAADSERQKVEALLEAYQETEELVMLCCSEDRKGPQIQEINQVFEDHPNMPPYIVQSTGAAITAHSAVSIVHWYCQQFMKNPYANIIPNFIFDEDTTGGYICTLEMPLISRIREKPSNSNIPMKNKHDARAYVALEMCKILHRRGELNDHLLPKKRIDSILLLPLKPADEDAEKALQEVQVKTANKQNEKKRYKLPRTRAHALITRSETIDCPVQETFYLYVFKSRVVQWTPRSQNRANEILFDPESFSGWVGLLLNQKCEQIDCLPKFSIYTRSGEEQVDIRYVGPVSLTETEKRFCSRFNRYVFSFVLGLSDNLVDIDYNEDRQPLFATPCVVAVNENEPDRFEMDFALMSADLKLKQPDFQNFTVDEKDYEDAVVELLFHINENLPRYDRDKHTKVPEDSYPRFIVRETRCRDDLGEPLTPNTPGFYKFNESLTFVDYALSRNLRCGVPYLLSEDQPVMRVEHVPVRLRMTTPRYNTKAQSKYRILDAEDDDYEADSASKIIYGRTSHVIPQFVALHQIKGSLWRKLSSFASMFYRLNRLLIAEDYRSKIASATKIGPIQCEKTQWPAVKMEYNTKETIQSKPMREINRMLISGDRTYDESALKLTLLQQPDLSTCIGPGPADIMKALSTKGTCEIFDLERLELLGDAFLYLVATFATIDRMPTETIRELNTYRQFQVTNRHLLYRAYEHQLTSALEVLMFLPTVNFLPPGFKAIPHEEKLLDRNFLNYVYSSYGFDFASELSLKDLRFAQHLPEMIKLLLEEDEETRENNMKLTTVGEDELPSARNVPVKMWHTVKAKIGGDVVESLIGTYLEKCGPVGALRFMNWIGIDYGNVTSDNFLDVFTLDFSSAQNVPIEKLARYSHLIKKVEDCLDFEFKSKGLVLEAITHHSCREHMLTYDNLRLAFLGEAIMDYLLTLYIYRLNSNLSPGQLTDLRCALVNSHIAAHAVVHCELHTVLLYSNTKLFSTIKRYLSNIEEIGIRMNTVLGDWETENSEEAEVPRPLARLLHALLAAVFIDSGKDLETAWRILVKVLGYEISLLTTHIPLSPVNELLQKCPGTTFSRPVFITDGADKDKVEVTMNLRLPNGETEIYKEVQETKKAAKNILAKRYLRKLEIEERLNVIKQMKSENREESSVVTQCEVLLESELIKSKFYRVKK